MNSSVNSPAAVLLRSAHGAIGTHSGAPRTTSESLSASVLWGVLYACLYGLLAHGGHQPSATKYLPTDPEIYYLCAAIYSLPCCVGLTCIASGIAGYGARFETKDWTAGIRVFATAYAGPFIWFLVVPEILVFIFFGFGALGEVARFFVPLVALVVVKHFYTLSRLHFHVSKGRAIAMTFVAAFAQALPLAYLFR
jgi:hypothetical protein